MIFRWNLLTGEATKVCELPEDVYPTDLHTVSRSQSSGKRHGQDQFLITSTDGMKLEGLEIKKLKNVL